MAEKLKTYLGDGAYAEFDGFAIILTTENGMTVQNTVVLEPEALRALERFVARTRALAKGGA
jgi:hypothetical protein